MNKPKKPIKDLSICKEIKVYFSTPIKIRLKYRRIEKFAPYYQLREDSWSKKEQLLAMKINEIIEALESDKEKGD